MGWGVLGNPHGSQGFLSVFEMLRYGDVRMTVVCTQVLDEKDHALRTPLDRLWVVLHRLINPRPLGRRQDILYEMSRTYTFEPYEAQRLCRGGKFHDKVTH